MQRTRWILRFLAGPRLGDTVPLPTGAEQEIGRGRSCAIRLPESNAHHRHALLGWEGEVPRLRDVGTRNGVFRNGHPITDAVLGHWDLLVIGASVVRVEDRDLLDPVLGAGPSGTGSAEPAGGAATPAADPGRARQVVDYERLFECLLTIQDVLNQPDDAGIVERSLEALFTILPATRLSLITIDPDGTLHQGFTLTPNGPTSEYIGQSFARRILADGRPLLMDDASAADAGDWGATIQDQHVQSILGAPVMGASGPLGVLLADNRDTPGTLREKHLRILEFAVRALSAAFQRRDLRGLITAQALAAAEFEAARKVQEHLFNKDPATIAGAFRWRARYQPAESVGGDYYDFHRNGDCTTWVVADVTGHGISAALVVSMLKGFCKLLYPEGMGPADFLRRLNGLFVGELPPAIFLTAAVFCVHDDGTLVHASLGHPPFLHLKADGSHETLPSSPGFLGRPERFGMLRRLVEQRAILAPGDRLLAVSDGLLEIGMEDGAQFGDTRLLEILPQLRGMDLDQALDLLLAEAKEFLPGPQADDITLVIGGME